MTSIMIDNNEANALAFEYQGYYGTASGDVNISDIVNNPNAFGIVCVFGPGFSEKITDLPLIKVGVFSDD